MQWFRFQRQFQFLGHRRRAFVLSGVLLVVSLGSIAVQGLQLGIDFTAHVVGFDIGEPADRAQLQCLADNTGGNYYAAADSEGLQRALTEVSRASELTISVLASPGTPISRQCPRAKVAARICRTTCSWP